MMEGQATKRLLSNFDYDVHIQLSSQWLPLSLNALVDDIQSMILLSILCFSIKKVLDYKFWDPLLPNDVSLNVNDRSYIVTVFGLTVCG